jgi:1-acyl-sn-glycerol-3-phosphate acyltransferase
MKQARPAIPAAKNRPGYAAIYWLLVRRALWRQFDSVRVQIVGPLPRREEAPLICYLNHPAWWDAYMAALIDRKLLGYRFESYGMMEEPQLRAYRFFTWAGAFSVDRHNPREAARSVAYIGDMLQDKPGRALFIFPQGILTPNDQRPLTIFPGLAHIVRRVGGATLCPVALRYEFRGEQSPDAFIRLGPVHHAAAPVDIHTVTHDVQQRLTAATDALRDAVVADDMGQFRILLHGKPGINRLFDLARKPLSFLRS